MMNKIYADCISFALMNLKKQIRRVYGIRLDLSNKDFDLDHPDFPLAWSVCNWNKFLGCEGASFEEIIEFCINNLFVNGICVASLLSWVDSGGLLLYIRSVALEMEQSINAKSIVKINTCIVSFFILDIHLYYEYFT